MNFMWPCNLEICCFSSLCVFFRNGLTDPGRFSFFRSEVLDSLLSEVTLRRVDILSPVFPEVALERRLVTEPLRAGKSCSELGFIGDVVVG